MGASSLPPAWQLYLKDHRISTFKNWPFLEGCACTPERRGSETSARRENEDMYQCRGRVHRDLPLALCTSHCAPEAEGGVSVREEHKKHSSGCAFLSVKKQFEELTLSEFLKLDKERAKNKIAKETNHKQKEFEETAKRVRCAIEQLAALE
ncbi:baculoviral IAP repeat-containing protein 5 [Puma concolor]|uniref:Baculoviral IAP repeat-containing protein 5 n=1 Tax=Puma concolor TaxID=9696 RepID=A0A6P6I5B1_PUMCO|nr:baculoviral IAP repeat-containing protein 5 [Puma concolor]